MTATPQEPDSTLTEEERRTVRSAAVRAAALVAQAEPGLIDSFKESFAASRAVRSASPDVQKLVAGGMPEMPSGSREESDARTLELVEQAVAVLAEKAPQLLAEYRSVVLTSAKDVAAAADDVSSNEAAALARVESALGGGS